MREFIVVGHTAETMPDFTLNDLPGSAGRLDILCRCVNSAFFLSHGLREDVRCTLVLQDTYTIHIEGSTVQYLNPDERSTGALLKKALEKASVTDMEPGEAHRSSPGISITRGGLAQVLDDLSAEATVIQLHEDGDPLVDVPVPDHPVFVLSDHCDFSRDETELLQSVRDRTVRVGPHVLHADHTITVTHNYLDTAGYSQY